MPTTTTPTPLPPGAISATGWNARRDGRVTRFFNGPIPDTSVRVYIFGEEAYGAPALLGGGPTDLNV